MGIGLVQLVWKLFAAAAPRSAVLPKVPHIERNTALLHKYLTELDFLYLPTRAITDVKENIRQAQTGRS